LFANGILFIGLLRSLPWLFLFGLIHQMLIILILFIISFSIHIGHWNQAELFYAGLIPAIAGFIFLYCWIVIYGHLRNVLLEQTKTSPRGEPLPPVPSELCVDTNLGGTDDLNRYM
jgi:hypothetical protein